MNIINRFLSLLNRLFNKPDEHEETDNVGIIVINRGDEDGQKK